MKAMRKTTILFCSLLVMALNIQAQSYKLPDYKSFTLSNGLTVNLMEQHDVPVISVSVILPAGAIYDSSQSGIASLTANALKHGTNNYTKSKLDEALDYVGATISTYSGKEYAGLSSKFATKDQELVLNLIKEILIAPTFDVTEFEKAKARTLVSLTQEKESPRSVIGDYNNKLIYGNHVYSNKINGLESTVSQFTVNDIKSFYKTHYSPNNAAISIVGDFSTKAMKKSISKLFSSWKKGKTSENLASQPVVPYSEAKVLLVNKEDAKETTFYIGGKGISRNNTDYIGIDIVNTLFGGRFTSMLNDELRVNSGLTYGAGSRFNTYRYSGTFYISTFTALETTEQAIDKTLEVLRNLHENGLDEKGLTSAKNYVKGQFPPDYETTGQLAGLLSEMFWFDFDKSFINDFEKNVDAINLKKANEIIKTYFPKDKLQFVLIGKTEAIKDIAKKYGKVINVEIKEEITGEY
ncbi:M16 family metallopeptidase [Aureibaculum luteum]|uniref:M16 family metallopeptidase n=1 Tax=Aureibaculum luteum TaxID=1548456 RepID=UPI000E46B700|nr:pitrilysin family protein [Aureibaculum luteum]